MNLRYQFGWRLLAGSTTGVAALCLAPAVCNAQGDPLAGLEPTSHFRYEVALPDGTWGSSVSINPGDRVEWRVVLSYVGNQNVAALGRVFYQPVLANVDNDGAGSQVDRLGDWRNGGVSGQGNSTLAQGLLNASEGQSSASLTDYGRVVYGFSSRSTNAGNSGPLTSFRHSGGSDGAPPGNYMRIAGSNNPQWYPIGIPNGSVALNNQILWGVVSDNHSVNSTWFATGAQNIVVFRQSFIASSDVSNTERVVTLFSELWTLQRAGGSAGTDDTRFMTWALPGEGGSTATVRSDITYFPAEIHIVPTPGVMGLIGVGGLLGMRRRR